MCSRLFPLLTICLIATVTLCAPAANAEPPASASDEQAFQASVERLAIQSLIRKGAWEELYVRCANGLAATPNDPVLLRGKIRALRQLGYGSAARKSAQQARILYPNDPDLLLEQTWLALTAGEWQQVLRDTETEAAKSDSDNELLLLRGIALRETGQTAAAITLFSRLLERKPTDCVALTNRGRLLVKAGKDAPALADLTAAIACTSNPEPLLARGTLLLRLGRPAEALTDLNKGLGLVPDNLSGLLARSEARFLTGDITGASQDLMIARQISPTDQRIEPLSCRLASATGDWSVVAGCAEQSAKLTPSDPAVWRTLAKARLESGNLNGAIAAYDTLVKLAANDQRARLERATVQIMRRDYAAAAADCSAVIEHQPLATAYALRSLAHYRDGKLSQADEDSTNALVLDRTEQTATLVRANLALARNDLQTATADCERVMQRAPKSPWGVITCGRVYLQAGDLKKAAAYAERALELAPADPETKELSTRIASVQPATVTSSTSNRAVPQTPALAQEK